MKKITDIPALTKRPVDGHKGTFGKVLIVGGSVGFSGAPALAGKAALRSGSGLVRIAVPQSIQPVVSTLDPCYTTIGLSD
ncbi:MAG: NAD(P)H-hydrate dehydratase, partial [Planctomycetota bacterium]